jgi:hypothetical protein
MLRDVLVHRVIHGLLGFGIGRSGEIPQPTVGREQDAPFIQPTSRKLHQAVEGDGLVGFASHLPGQRALTPFSKGTKAQKLSGPCLMFIECRAAAVQRAQRGEFRGGKSEFCPEMLQHGYGHRIEGV